MTSKSDIAVSVRGLSKSYAIAHNAVQHSTMGEALVHRLKNPFHRPERETFWALQDVDFDIHKGDVVGIIGRNGAGKSTLLKILSRITEPTHGKAILNGRVGSLLEVGTGFHPELTGRENIYLNGAILGMTKHEIARQFDAIVDFSGTEQFLDTPVKRYSSGMYVRLAYAVAAHLRTEILIVDEVLAVGDSQFQQKCLRHMRSLTLKGVTVLLVSHNMAAIQSCCNTSIYLERGIPVIQGRPSEMIKFYLNSLSVDNKDDERSRLDASRVDATDADVEITGFEMFGEDGVSRRAFRFGESPRIRIDVRSKHRIEAPIFNFGIRRGDGVIVCNFNNWYDNFKIDYIEGDCSIEGWLPPLRLTPNHFEVHVSIWPWGGAHQEGDMMTSQPFQSKRFGEFQISGPPLNAGDGIFQSPSRKWKFCDGERTMEFSDIYSTNLFQAFGDLTSPRD